MTSSCLSWGLCNETKKTSRPQRLFLAWREYRMLHFKMTVVINNKKLRLSISILQLVSWWDFGSYPIIRRKGCLFIYFSSQCLRYGTALLHFENKDEINVVINIFETTILEHFNAFIKTIKLGRIRSIFMDISTILPGHVSHWYSSSCYLICIMKTNGNF